MKIVVLGNGFDLACGLPTSYNDFFKARFEKFDYTRLETLYIELLDENYKKSDDIRKINYLHSTEERLLDILRSDFKINNAVPEKDEINFWDFYFLLLHFDDAPLSKWSDVEAEIFKALINDNHDSIIDYMLEHEFTTLKDAFTLNIYAPGGYKVNLPIKNLNDAIHYYFENTDSVKGYILHTYFTLKDKSLQTNDYSVFLDELIAFEKVFQNYITLVYENNLLKNAAANDNIYINNIAAIIGSSEYTSIINFNYTSIKDVIPYANKEGTPHILDKHIVESNVHGKYDKITIFGIDQKEFKNRTNKFTFTKTFRKMTESSLIEPIEFNGAINEIIFYGHSLAAADYSYFQSIFDQFDIYKSTINLNFKFSFFGDNSEKTQKRTISMNVSNLIRTYGETMDNKDHGNNLLHRLLLENRLHITPITLKELEVSK